MKRSLATLIKAVIILIPVGFCLSCALFNLARIVRLIEPDPQLTQKYPWITKPISEETRTYFCAKLGLERDHPICRPGSQVMAADLLEVLKQRFPEGITPYSDVAEALTGYPVEVENTKTPDGVVTTRRYVYLLTEFDGFCVYFSTTDLQSEVIERVYSSSLGSGPSPTVCGSAKLRAQPRPFRSAATPSSEPASTP